jgi:hypothetical protein
MIPAILSLIIAFSIMGTALVEITLNNFTIVGNITKSQQAFNIAEAGLNYYMWHLNHNATDYKDGKTTPTTPDPTLGYGPYVHNYIDTNGVNQGTYTLWIKPAGTGSTIVDVRSIGQAAGTSITRTVQAKIGNPSFASYGLVSDSEFWFGSNETANGPIFSNVGIHLDGPNTDVAGAANATYVPSATYGGDGATHPGVWCDTSVTTPVNCNTRNKSTWHYPSPSVNFNQVSGSLCTMKKVAFNDYATTYSAALASSNPCNATPTARSNAYIPQTSTTGSFSLTKGYLIKLNTNSTYDLLQVNSENDRAASYSTALSTTPIATNIAVPASGVIFVEDNVWVLTPTNFDGRVTIASGRLASTTNNTDIVLAGPLAYKTKNGADAIGLVTEGSINVAPYAPPTSGAFNFEIDGALLAETGQVVYGESQANNGLINYRSATNICARGWVNSNQTLNFYGSIATRQAWTWNQEIGGNCGDAVRDPANGIYWAGIENTTTSYDYNLQYAPPPSYPLTSGYNILSWREVITHP